MFKHQDKPKEAGEQAEAKVTMASSSPLTSEIQVKSKTAEPVPESARDLLEKNLKWSQIIYEQNRKINSKLFWMMFYGWFKFFIIAAVLGASVWFAYPMVKTAWQQYENLLGTGGILSGDKSVGGSLEEFLKSLPLSPAQKEQLKTMTK